MNNSSIILPILFINQTLQDTSSSGQNTAAKTHATLTKQLRSLIAGRFL